MKTKEVKNTQVILKKEESKISLALSLAISNGSELAIATELLSELKNVLDRITNEKEKVIKPLNVALKNERARWKPAELALEEAINSIRIKMTQYQTEQTRLKKEEEAKIASRVAPGKGHLSVETAIKKIGELAPVESHVVTDAGSIKFRPVKKFEVTDMTKLPLEYHLADEVAIRKAMVANVELPGVRYYEEQIPVNSRN